MISYKVFLFKFYTEEKLSGVINGRVVLVALLVPICLWVMNFAIPEKISSYLIRAFVLWLILGTGRRLVFVVEFFLIFFRKISASVTFE